MPFDLFSKVIEIWRIVEVEHQLTLIVLLEKPLHFITDLTIQQSQGPVRLESAVFRQVIVWMLELLWNVFEGVVINLFSQLQREVQKGRPRARDIRPPVVSPALCAHPESLLESFPRERIVRERDRKSFRNDEEVVGEVRSLEAAGKRVLYHANPCR